LADKILTLREQPRNRQPRKPRNGQAGVMRELFKLDTLSLRHSHFKPR
jgi:hypothetical protein